MTTFEDMIEAAIGLTKSGLENFPPEILARMPRPEPTFAPEPYLTARPRLLLYVPELPSYDEFPRIGERHPEEMALNAMLRRGMFYDHVELQGATALAAADALCAAFGLPDIHHIAIAPLLRVPRSMSEDLPKLAAWQRDFLALERDHLRPDAILLLDDGAAPLLPEVWPALRGRAAGRAGRTSEIGCPVVVLHSSAGSYARASLEEAASALREILES